MGVLRSTDAIEAGFHEFCKMLVKGSGSIEVGAEKKSGAVGGRRGKAGNVGDGDGRIVCVTSAMSLVGSAIVRRLQNQGYIVRLMVQTQEGFEKATRMIAEDMKRDVLSVVVADLMDLHSLCRAFEGCSGVFHTSAFTDPTGVSGYTKYMADAEARAAELVTEACVRTESVRKCVFTSSLLACIWRNDLVAVVDEKSWSDESLCREKKLWYALGKTMAERAAWKAARGTNLMLVSICPALITGQANSIAYLKGSEEMLADGLLATVDVEKVAETHVNVYKSDGAYGRYICSDNQLTAGTQEAEQLLSQFNKRPLCNFDQSNNQFQICDSKLSKLMSRSRRCSYDTYSFLY